MKNKITISIVTAILLITGIYFYNSNKDFKGFIQNKVIGSEKKAILSKEFFIYCIADGTYSGNTDYAIPQVDTMFISRIIDSIHINGSGKFWLSYIDKDSKNNRSVYFPVPVVTSKEPKPEERNGESSFDYQDRLKKWEQTTNGFSGDSIKKEEEFYTKKNEFLNKCGTLLKETVYLKSSENRFSDVIGSLNSSYKIMEKSNGNNEEKYIIAFSDLQQDTPNIDPLPALEYIPENVFLIATNPAPGSSDMITEDAEEVDSPERIFEIVFK